MRNRMLVATLATAVALVGCGESGDDAADTAAPKTEPAAAPVEFPASKGTTAEQLAAEIAEGPVFAPSVSVVKVGENRIGFALFDVARKQVDATGVALYTAPPDGSGLRGPYVARRESIAVKTAYRSEQAAADLADGDTIWVADVPFAKRGASAVFAVAEVDGQLVRTSPFEYAVGQGADPPDVGEKAISIRTETEADVGGDLAKLSTRLPPPRDMLQDDFADVVGKQPAVLQFATPQLCQTQVCGPVVDIAEQVRAESGDGVVFIQQEIYNDNKVEKGFRSQVGAWGLPTEPWTFVIDRAGKVTARFEGAFSVDELTRAVRQVQ